MDNIKFGKFIKELRKKFNMTQKELGEKLHVTDKAVSKWERGLSFPDITIINLLADTFGITSSEILNAELGKKEEIDSNKIIEETIEKITKSKEKKETRVLKTKKAIKIISLILFIISLIIQIGYIFFLKKHNYEYVIDNFYYVINEIIILSGTILAILFIDKRKIKKAFVSKIIIGVIFTILTIINIAFMSNNGFINKCIVSFSKDFSNELILKQNKKTGETTLYSNNKLYIFAKEKEKFSYAVEGEMKYQWLESDVCSITYTDKDNILREYVATYGDRSEGISYSYVTTALQGEWQVFSQYGNETKLTVDSKGIKVTKNKKIEQFEYEECKQFGTIAIVLYKNETPKYVIALNKDCKIDKTTGIIQKGGTISLSEVSMKKTSKEILECTTYKNDEKLNKYNIVSVPANSYKIKNDILYISYDGENIIEVPGDFSNGSSSYNNYNYQISEKKTIFFYNSKQKRYLVYSDDMGKNWQTIEISKKGTIQNIQFINSNIGFMLEFEDVAMSTAFGKISKTIDGGKNWIDINYGVGEGNNKIFKTSSQIKFVNENVGYLTMPNTGGENSELYITQNSGETFSKVNILESDIYDFYNLPTEENGKLYLKISQGSDGDYNKGDYKTYFSEDKGETWNLSE